MIDYSKYGITFQPFINKLDKHYADEPSQFCIDMKERPYMVLIGVVGMAFKSADELIQTRRCAAPDSRERCLYAVYHILATNEAYGNTRMKDSELARQVNNLCPEAMVHIVDIVKNDGGIYYEPASHWVSKRGTYNAEVNIAEHIKHRLANPVKLDVNVNKYRHNGDFELTNEQIAALQMVADNSVCMVNGAAGSGKSSVTTAIVSMLEDNDKTYQLLAPTGIASKILREKTGRNAMTCHLFLTGPHYVDYVILDEASICDVCLMSLILSKIGVRPNIVFIADNAQLASIQCGSMVQDMIKSNIVPSVTLTKIFRYNTSGIVTIATDVRNGTDKHLKDVYPDYIYIEENKNDPIAQVVQQYDKLIRDGYNIDDIIVLCPFNIKIGSDAINSAISDKYNNNRLVRKNSSIKLHDKVINIKNNYDEGLDDMIANGDIGYLQSMRYNREKKRYDVMVKFPDGLKNVKSLSNIKQAYSCSIHKVQGSSSKVVIVLIDKMHEFMCSRNLLYVAVTRATEKLVIIGDAEAIANGLKISENEARATWLKELLSKKDV